MKANEAHVANSSECSHEEWETIRVTQREFDVHEYPLCEFNPGKTNWI